MHRRELRFLISILLASVFIALVLVSIITDFLGLRFISGNIAIKITDTNPKVIADILKKHKIIKNKNEFLIYQAIYKKIKKITEGYKPGEFLLNPSMSYNSIIRNLTKTPLETVNVTIREGLTVREIAQLLEKNNVCKQSEFLDALENEKFDFWFLKEINESNLRINKYEGYLFPDTYEFYKGEVPKSIIKKFFQNFNKKIDEDVKSKVYKSGFSLDQVVILASIVQKEEGSGENAPKVAGVFLNRLRNLQQFPKLASDVTIDYVEKEIKPYINQKNQDVYDAYNTYKCTGLPIGPICNPGMIAINAVLQPEKNDYFYFLANKSGKFYFAKTLEEHNKNVKNEMNKF